MSSSPVKVTDLTMRDGHQSLFATRMRTADLTAIAAELDGAGFWSAEVWGGATFDVMTRFLNEDPWERLRAFKKLMPRTPLQMLLRGQNLVGYRNYADDVVETFVRHSAECGIDIFRVFDALNDERNFAAAFKAVKACGKHVQGAICYSLIGPKMGGPVYNVDYYVEKALIIQEMGADSLCIKDMAGLIAPDDAFTLTSALKKALRIPVCLHSHFTSGMAAMSQIKAIEAGADIVDTCLAPLAYRTSHPAVEPLVVALQGSPRNTGLDLERLLKLDAYFDSIVPKYRDFLDTTRFSIIDTGVLKHQVPGGMFTNMVAQLREAGALDRLPEVYAELPRLREELGYPPLVTPTSQIVGIQAVQNVLFGRYKMVSREIKDYVYGLYGHPPAPISPEVQKLLLAGYDIGKKPFTGRPADILKPEMDRAREATKGLARDTGDVLCYALYPTAGLRFLKWKYGLEAPPPETRSKTLDDVKREDDLTKAKKGLADSSTPAKAPPKSPATRTFNVFVDNEYFRVEVDDAGRAPAMAPHVSVEAREAMVAEPVAAEPAPASSGLMPGETAVLAPLPGMVVCYLVKVGDSVKAGTPVVVVETMKMENTLPAPSTGKVRFITHKSGDRVARNDILAVIA